MSEAQTEKPSRPVHLFSVPGKLSSETDIQEVGLITLTADEELQAYKRAGQKDNAKLATELAKAALVEFNGKPLKLADGTVDTFWKNLDPRVRQLVLSAYAELHGADEDDQKSFLASRKVRVA